MHLNIERCTFVTEATISLQTRQAIRKPKLKSIIPIFFVKNEKLIQTAQFASKTKRLKRSFKLLIDLVLMIVLIISNIVIDRTRIPK